MRRQLHPQTVRRRWHVACGAFVLALLLAQTLGVLHRYTHGPQGVATSGVAAHSHDPADPSHARHDHDDSSDAAPGGHALVGALFDSHEDESSECKLYDQLTHGDALWSAVAAFTSTPPKPGHVPVAAPAACAGVASWFLARAPPARA
jgi:hypothetical protein